MTKAVIFDMDGVLFNTEYIVSLAWSEVAKKRKIEEIELVLNSCIGRSYEDTRLVFSNHYGENFDFEGFREDARVLFNAYIEREGLPVKEGVYELLSYLKEEGYKIGLASSTKKENILSHLKEANITSYFDVVIGGDMVKHSKPHPEIYKKAYEALEVTPEETFCIEDSLNGIKSGYAAGLKVIMVPDLIMPTEEIMPLLHKKCNSLLEVKAYLESI